MADQNSGSIMEDEIAAMNNIVTGNGGNGSIDPAAALSAEFSNTATVEKTKRPKKILTAAETHNAEVISTVKNSVIQRSEDIMSKPLGILMKAFTANARLCGVLTDNGPKYDFSLTSKKKKAEGSTAAAVEYAIKLVNSAPSTPKTFIFRVPTNIMGLIADDSQRDMTQIMAAIENPTGSSIEFVPREKLDEWMRKYTTGVIYEAEEIFVPFTKKSGTNVKTFTKYEDCVQIFDYQMAEKFPAIYRQVSVNKAGEVKIDVKHSFRSRIIDPSNYISKTTYSTTSVPAVLSKEQAAQFTMLYLQKYVDTKNDATSACKLNRMINEQQKHFVVVRDGNGYKLESNDLFTADSSRSIYNSFTVDDWYQRDIGGNPVRKKASEVKLARKELKENAKSPVYIKNELVPADIADPEAYRFNPNWPVIKASHGGLTYDLVKNNLARKTASKAKPKQQTVKLGGAQLIGISQEEFSELLNRVKHQQ